MRSKTDPGRVWAIAPRQPRLSAFMRHVTASALAHPLWVCLPVQVALLFTDPGRLPTWGDEYASVQHAALPFRELISAPHGAVHPPLYFLLLHGWLALTWGPEVIVRARWLSALSVLLATIAIDRCWLRRVERWQRLWFLVLWTLSPAVLLYGRMVRSYSLQLLLTPLALYAGWVCIRQPSWSAILLYSGVTALLLSTHFLPGIAVITAVALALLVQLPSDPRPARFAALLVPPIVIGVGLTAWLPFFWKAIGYVSSGSPYRVLGNTWLERLASLGYTFVSFTFGESLWPWMLGAALILTPAVVVLVIRGLLLRPEWLVLVGPVAVVSYLVASNWVSYAFVGARLIFLLPFYLLLLVSGARTLPRVGAMVLGGLALVSTGGITAYFAQEGFLNKAYVIPFSDIGRHVRDHSGPATTVVILDDHSTSLTSITPDLPPAARIVLLRDPKSVGTALQLAEEPHLGGVVWFARSTHDTSPGGWNTQIEAAFLRRFQVHRERFCPYSAVDHWLMRQAGWSEQPSHAVEVLEMRPIPAS